MRERCGRALPKDCPRGLLAARTILKTPKLKQGHWQANSNADVTFGHRLLPFDMRLQ
jgi:hypothetical protein